MRLSPLERLIRKIFCTPERIGNYGEKLVVRELKLLRLFGRKGRILRNVYIPKPKEETAELDVIYITQKGIFIVESKNYSGWIFGNENDKYWTAMLENRQKNSFYNPILQNASHLKWTRAFVGEDVPLFSIVAFSERCELKKVTVTSKDVRVVKRDRLYATIRSIWKEVPDALAPERVDELYDELYPLTKVDKEFKRAHVETIRRKYAKESERDA